MSAALGASMTSAGRLEPFLLLGKSARGAAAVKLIEQSTSAPGCFFFGELLRCPGIQELRDDEASSDYYRLLEAFAYSTFNEYYASQPPLPTLTASQQTKLRQLTLVSLALRSRTISYATLATELCTPSGPAGIRELEDLIIDAIYAGVLSGRLDQKRERLDVEGCSGRDVKPDQIPGLLSQLEEWSATVKETLARLGQEIQNVRSVSGKQSRLRAEHEQTVYVALTEVQAALESKPTEHRDGGKGGAHSQRWESAGGRGGWPGGDSAQDRSGSLAMDLDDEDGAADSRGVKVAGKKKPSSGPPGRAKRSRP